MFDVYNNFYEGKRDTVIIFLCKGEICSSIKSNEISKYAYYKIDSLPSDTSPGTRKRINEYIRKDNPIVTNW